MNTEPQVNDFVEYKNEIYTIGEISPFTQFGENHTMYLLSLAGTLTNARIYEYHFKSGEATIISDPHRGNRSTVVYEYSAVRLKGGKFSVYYSFDSNGKFQANETDDYPTLLGTKLGEEIYHACFDNATYDRKIFKAPIESSFWKNCKKYCSGFTKDEIIDYVRNNIDLFLNKAPCKKDYSNELVMSIRKPIFERYTGNKNTDTFDVIRVEECLSVYGKEDLLSECKRRQKELIQLAVNTITESKQWQKYNIPINCLKIYNIVLTNEKTLMISFCLKMDIETEP